MNKSKNYSNLKLSETIDKLYQDSKNRDLIYKQNVEQKNKKLDTEFENLNFKPETIAFNSTIFKNNPMENNKSFKRNVERQERARVEKKSLDDKGMIMRTLDKEENIGKPAWNFGIDKKCSKDTFSVYNKLNKSNSQLAGNFKSGGKLIYIKCFNKLSRAEVLSLMSRK